MAEKVSHGAHRGCGGLGGRPVAPFRPPAPVAPVGPGGAEWKEPPEGETEPTYDPQDPDDPGGPAVAHSVSHITSSLLPYSFFLESCPACFGNDVRILFLGIGLNDCCCSGGFCKRMREKGVTGHMLMHDDEWRCALLWFAKLVMMSIADVVRSERQIVEVFQSGW